MHSCEIISTSVLSQAEKGTQSLDSLYLPPEQRVVDGLANTGGNARDCNCGEGEFHSW